MVKVVNLVNDFFVNNPAPLNIKHQWFGLTYINVIWQKKMVMGMAKAFIGSFFIVFLMMTVLFRSALWGIIAMIPLTITIGFIYGAVGLIGKDYDMPIAVLSSLTLGLAVDFAIHFLVRSREVIEKTGAWEKSLGIMFDEPARAIVRNIAVIAIGFIPLLAAPLIPYKTVGAFLATILVVAGIATLMILPSLIKMLENKLFTDNVANKVSCKCATCAISALTIAVIVIINLQEYMKLGWVPLTGIILGILIISVWICHNLSKRDICNLKN